MEVYALFRKNGHDKYPEHKVIADTRNEAILVLAQAMDMKVEKITELYEVKLDSYTYMTPGVTWLKRAIISHGDMTIPSLCIDLFVEVLSCLCEKFLAQNPALVIPTTTQRSLYTP
jgi:hypothetical protein